MTTENEETFFLDGSTKNCPMCGTEIPEEAPDCRYCGEEQPGASRSADSDRLWRDGNILVMEKDAQLPDICLKSNRPAEGRRLKRNLYWHHPAIYLCLLAGVLIYIILAMILQKRATVHIGLSREWFAKRRWAITTGWFLFLGGLGLFFYSFSIMKDYPWMIIVGVVVWLTGAIYGLLAARMVAPKQITKTHVWLKGVHPDFLNNLPQWNGGY